MVLYWIIGYRIRDGQASAFQDQLRSADFRKLRQELLAETGIRIAETYLSVEPSSVEPDDYDAWDVWELPNCAAIDRYVQSKARDKFLQEYVGRFVGSSYRSVTGQKQEFLL